jgi:hypothetical protein
MPILNYTTSIAANKSAAEVQQILARHGASQVSLMYEGGEPAELAFTIETPYGLRDFQLPANAAGVRAALDKAMRARQLAASAKLRDPQQANRIAWRILKDWVEAQLAIIEAGMSTMDEVMLPYLLTPSGKTLAAAYRESAERDALMAGVQAAESA